MSDELNLDGPAFEGIWNIPKDDNGVEEEGCSKAELTISKGSVLGEAEESDEANNESEDEDDEEEEAISFNCVENKSSQLSKEGEMGAAEVEQFKSANEEKDKKELEESKLEVKGSNRESIFALFPSY